MLPAITSGTKTDNFIHHPIYKVIHSSFSPSVNGCIKGDRYTFRPGSPWDHNQPCSNHPLSHGVWCNMQFWDYTFLWPVKLIIFLVYRVFPIFFWLSGQSWHFIYFVGESTVSLSFCFLICLKYFIRYYNCYQH